MTKRVIAVLLCVGACCTLGCPYRSEEDILADSTPVESREVIQLQRQLDQTNRKLSIASASWSTTISKTATNGPSNVSD